MKDKLHAWWNQPVDYDWTVAYYTTNPRLRAARTAIGLWCWLHVAIFVLAALASAQSTDTLHRGLLVVLSVSTTVVGALWIRGPWPDEATSKIFVLYSELGLAIALIVLLKPSIALPFAALFSVIGSHIAVFHSSKLFVAHEVWAGAVLIVVYVRAVVVDDASPYLFAAYFVLLCLVLFSAPVLSHALLLLLRQDAAAAMFDPLTGLRNRRGFNAAIADIPAGPVIAMVLDLDNFKSINDRFGHREGDAVIRRAAYAIDFAFPPPAVTSRTGGEEFAVIVCVEIDIASARAQQLRLLFADRADKGDATVSIGISQLDDSHSAGSIQNLLGRADNAMYIAKRLGGNTVVHDASTAPTGG